MENKKRVRPPHSEETKKKIAAGNTGQIFSQERREAISKANTGKANYDDFLNIKRLLEENVCSLHAICQYLNVKMSKAMIRLMRVEGVSIHEELRFFAHSIDYESAKKLLAYLRLSVHHTEIQERLGLSQKIIHGALLKLRKIHGFTYSPRRKPCRTTKTKIEVITSKILDESSTNYTTEYSFGNFFYDVHITGTNLFIEVNGDYWHANPVVYQNKEMLNDTQKSNVRRDNYKRRYAKDRGFYVLYIWEKDLNTDYENTKIKLLKFVRRAIEKSSDFEIL